MPLLSFTQVLKSITRLLALGMLLLASGCCGNLLVSQRFHDGCASCAAGDCASSMEQVATPDSTASESAVSRPSLPRFCWPGWLHRGRLHAARQQMSHEIEEFLDPGPPPPVKPPHSRFHPLPTQPVFAARAEYRAPEVVGLTPEQRALQKRGVAPQLLPEPEDVPTPAAEPVPDAHQKPTPASDPFPGNPPTSREPTLLPPPADPTKGPIAPASFESPEPNPLRVRN